MNGLKMGLEFYKRVRLGFGFYGNNTDYDIPNPLFIDSARRTGTFNYSTFFTEVVLYRNFRWEFSIIGAMGSGRVLAKNYVKTGSIYSYTGHRIYEDVKVRDIALNTQFKIFSWLGMGMGVGYRHVFNLDDDNLQTAYRDPYLDFKIKIFLGYAMKAIFKPSAIEEEKVYYEYRREKRKKEFKELFNLE